ERDQSDRLIGRDPDRQESYSGNPIEHEPERRIEDEQHVDDDRTAQPPNGSRGAPHKERARRESERQDPEIASRPRRHRARTDQITIPRVSLCFRYNEESGAPPPWGRSPKILRRERRRIR